MTATEEKLRLHTTHHDDCGCLSDRYKKELARLKASNAALVKAAKLAMKILREWNHVVEEPDIFGDIDRIIAQAQQEDKNPS